MRGSLRGRKRRVSSTIRGSANRHALGQFVEGIDYSIRRKVLHGAPLAVPVGHDDDRRARRALQVAPLTSSKMPMLERKDYVFNANDSFWLANADALIEGDFSLLHGEQKTKRSPRTQENAILLSDTEATGPSGDDSKFSLEELKMQRCATGDTSHAIGKQR